MNTSANECEAADSLKLWHKQYLEASAESISMDSPIIQAVQSDKLDYSRIEVEVKTLIANADVLRGFCGNCRTLLDHWPEEDISDGVFTLGRAIHSREIEASARAGCKFCTFLFSKLRTNSELGTVRKIEGRLNLLGSDETTTLSVFIDWQIGGPGRQMIWLNFPQKTARSPWSSSANMCSSLSEQTRPTSRLWQKSLQPLEIAKVWLANCRETHKWCRNKQSQPPTRLLRVDRDKVHVVITKTLPKIPHYATLSYCWGKDAFIELSRKNLMTYMDCIPWEELPQTFQDAIQVARKLGLDFIWIDALCIIQDAGDDDWAIEAGRMSLVYGGAFVSLAASDAHNVYEGFLQRRGPSADCYSGGFTARVTSKTFCEVRKFYDYWDYARIVTNCHLSTRGWTFQERLLPMRTIHFTNSGLWWNCRSQTSSEYVPDGSLTGILDRPFMPPVGQPWRWEKIAWHYSGTNLTYGSDRLAALSGIAARQHEATGDQYLAGLWRKGLIYDLLWRLEEHREEARPSITERTTERTVRNRFRPDWRAPTWSWLSVDGKVAFGEYSQFELRVWSVAPIIMRRGHTSQEKSVYDEHIYVRILDAKTTPSGPDPFGPVSSGKLTIACSNLIRGRLGHVASPEDLAGVIPFDSGHGVFPVVIDCWEDALFKDERVVYLLPFLKGDYTLWGLVVQADDSSRGQFRRAGCFCFNARAKPEHQENHFLNFTEVLEKLGDLTAAAECVRTTPVLQDEDRRYVITLV